MAQFGITASHKGLTGVSKCPDFDGGFTLNFTLKLFKQLEAMQTVLVKREPLK